jgi:hypothetical protein
MLTRVTITGADDLVPVSLLRALSDEFPFVEWGVLRSATREGAPRYPKAEWREELEHVSRSSHEMSLSAHFCGQLVRDTMTGDMKWFKSLPAEYDRVQLNGYHQSIQSRGAVHQGLIQEDSMGAVKQAMLEDEFDLESENAHVREARAPHLGGGRLQDNAHDG